MKDRSFGVQTSAFRTINRETWESFPFTSQERTNFALNRTAKLNTTILDTLTISLVVMLGVLLYSAES